MLNERLASLLKGRYTIPGVVGVAGLGLGLGIGYLVAQKRNQDEIRYLRTVNDSMRHAKLEGIKAEIEELRQKRQTQVKEVEEEEIPSPVEEFISAKLNDKVPPEENSDPEDDLVKVNIFPEKQDEWDQEEELKKRNPSQPYVIHKDEFYADERNYNQHTLSYYAGDDIMCDEEDSPVYNYAQVIGKLNFGHGSGDPNVFYVRNDKRKTEYEIIYNQGLFSVEVMGLEIENNQRVKDIKHSNNRKFRDE